MNASIEYIINRRYSGRSSQPCRGWKLCHQRSQTRWSASTSSTEMHLSLIRARSLQSMYTTHPRVYGRAHCSHKGRLPAVWFTYFVLYYYIQFMLLYSNVRVERFINSVRVFFPQLLSRSNGIACHHNHSRNTIIKFVFLSSFFREFTPSLIEPFTLRLSCFRSSFIVYFYDRIWFISSVQGTFLFDEIYIYKKLSFYLEH